MGAFLKKIIEQILRGGSRKPPKKLKDKPTNQEPGCTTKCKLNIKVKRPIKRHDPCKTKGKDRTKSENTVIDPDVDISSDIDALNSGNFIRKGEDYVVGKRIYGMHPDTGRIFPKSGPGFIDIDRAQHQLLKELNSGAYENAMKFAKNKPGLTQEKIDEILKLWRKCK